MRRSRASQLDLPLRFSQQAVGRAHLTLDGQLVTYEIKRSSRRRGISILIDEEGMRVSAPWDASHRSIEQLLRRHGAWVLRKVSEWRRRRAPCRRWADGEPVMLIGQSFTLKLEIGSPHTGIRASHLVVGVDSASPDSVEGRVRGWLQEQALGCFEERVAYYRGLLGIRGVPEVLLSNARSRWGSCHSSGRIRLNWRLVQMPAHLIDYVIAHEVSHLIEMNHSERFWRAVAQVVPEYKARREELRTDGHRYLLI